MKYQAIKEQASQYGVRPLCTALGVSASGYYAWRRRRPSARQQANEQLVTLMRQVHTTVDAHYGSPRM